MIEGSEYLSKAQAQKLNIVDGKSNGVPVTWYSRLDDVELTHFEGEPVWTVFVANEFFDALPIYKFEKTEAGWRELVVDINENETLQDHFKLAVAPGPTKSSIALLTPQVLSRFTSSKVGDRIELSPDTESVIASISKTLSVLPEDSPSRFDIDRTDPKSFEDPIDPPRGGGMALICDYGTTANNPKDSLRGIRNHKFVSPFQNAGQVDLSANVDFEAIELAVKDKLYYRGCLYQREFLKRMGIEQRAKYLKNILKNASEKAWDQAHPVTKKSPYVPWVASPSEQATLDALDSGVSRLLASPGMGTSYYFALLCSHRITPYPFDMKSGIAHVNFLDSPFIQEVDYADFDVLNERDRVQMEAEKAKNEALGVSYDPEKFERLRQEQLDRENIKEENPVKSKSKKQSSQ